MLNHFFHPKSIAVLGASRTPGKLGNNILKNIIRSGFSGKIYPVNPKTKKILGHKCYASVNQVPGRIDLAVFSVPAPFVLSLMEECGRRGVRSAIIITAGFKETGLSGAKMERAIKSVARRHRIRVLGPNCVGLIDTRQPLNSTFSATSKMPPRGKIAFFSQSGALCMAVLDWTIKEGVGLSKLISLGNKIDIDEVSLLKYLGRDPETEVILGYLEGIKNGQAFMKAAAAVSKRKPIILVKSGTTAAGARAVSSHTGSLAGREVAYRAAFAQSGVIRANNLEELFDLAKAFYTRTRMTGPKLAVVTNSGGPGVLATDAVVRSTQLKMADFTEPTIKKLRQKLPAGVSVYNPIDVIADAPEERYRVTLKTVLKDKNVHAGLVIFTPATEELPARIARTIVRVARQTKKPLFTSFMGGELINPGIKILDAAGIPNYPFPERAIAALETLSRYHDWVRLSAGQSKIKLPVISSKERSKINRLLQNTWGQAPKQLGDLETMQVLKAYGVSVPAGQLAKSSAKAVKVARKIGYPVVLKIDSPDIIHKTDVKGVRLNIQSGSEVKEIFDELVSTARLKFPEAKISGVSVQPMITGGKEVIIGVSRDPQFGPLIMFGLGGIYVEALKDVSFRIAPVSGREVESMLREVRAYPLLAGMRGEPSVDFEVLKETILRVSKLVTDFPQILELDINPFKVFPRGQGGLAIDGRMTVKGEDWV